MKTFLKKLRNIPNTFWKSNYIIFFFFFIITFFLCTYIIQNPPFIIQIQLESNTPGTGQIYYEEIEGNGYTENTSTRFTIKQGEHNYVMYYFSDSIMSLRIDPIDKKAHIEIQNISYGYPWKQEALSDEELSKRIILQNQLAFDKDTADETDLKSLGNDPYFVIKNIDIRNAIPWPVRYIISFFCACIGSILLVLFFSLSKVLFRRYVSNDKKSSTVISNKSYNIITTFLFIFFIGQALYFAVTIAYQIPPDEIYHVERTIFQYRIFPNPFLADSTETFKHGAISTWTYIYHYLLSPFLLITKLFPDMNAVLYLRILNVCISTLNLYIGLLLIKKLTNNKIIQLICIGILTNILMFVFISGSVSYDNLTNLLGTASFYVLYKLFKKPKLKYIIILCIVNLCNMLVKSSTIPLFILQIIGVAYFYKSALLKPVTLYTNLFKSTLYTIDYVLIFLTIIFVLLNIHLYGGNYIRYNSPITPKEADVLENNPEYTEYLKSYSPHSNYELQQTKHLRKKMNILEFSQKYSREVVKRSIGIMAHKSIYQDEYISLVSYIVIFVSILLLGLQYRRYSKAQQVLIIITFLYLLIVLYINYKRSYEPTHMFGLALQGRYNFPVLIPLVYFLVNSLLHNIRDRAKIIIGIIFIGFLFYNSFLFFIINADDIWYNNFNSSVSLPSLYK